MAFVIQNWNMSTVSTNIYAPVNYSYITTTDTITTVVAANYFSQVAYGCAVGTQIYAVCSNGVVLLEVSAINNSVNPATISVTQILSGGTGVLASATGTLTQANWQGMFAAPVTILAAQGTGIVTIVDSFVINYHYATAAFAGGGAIGLQYGATANLAGVAATTQISATFSTETASTFAIALPTSSLDAVASASNAALTISNATAAFTAGNASSTLAWTLRYYTIAMT